MKPRLCAICAALPEPADGCVLCLCHNAKGVALEVHHCTVYPCRARFLGASALGQHLRAAHRSEEVPAWATCERAEARVRSEDGCKVISMQRARLALGPRRGA